MASALTGNKIKDSYQALLKMGTNGSLDPTTLITISDGLGNDTPLQLAGDKLATNYLGDEKGLKLDFVNNQYQFGDYNGISFYGQLIITNGASELVSANNNLGLFGPSLNTVLGYFPGSINTNDPSANSNNYVFGSDWLIDNSDGILYPFKYNTVLNCYNAALDTSDIAMFYNLFANIQDSGFNLEHFIRYDEKDSVSNCLIFGLTDNIGPNTLKIKGKNFNSTNVVVLNGSNLLYESNTSNVFSVNASSVTFDSINNSGINILGGDFAWKNDFYPANHLITGSDKYGINIQGRKALVKNNFLKVTSEWFRQYNTSQGQVQIEEKLLFQYYLDGSSANLLVDTFEEPILFLQSSATYRINAKIVSTTGDGNKASSGNFSYDVNWMACTDSAGNVDITDYCDGCKFDIVGAASYEMQIPTQGGIQLRVVPDQVNGNECWVQAYITLQCITTG